MTAPRPSPRLGWVVGVLLALVVNTAVFVGLAPAPVVVAEPPMKSVVLSVTTMPEPPEPPPAEAGVAGAAPGPVAVPVAAPSLGLPALDLPLTGDPALATGSGSALGSLLEVPAPALTLPAVTASVEAVEPPVLQGGLQLDRFYPYVARSRGLTGSSRLSLDLDAAGAVVGIRVLDSTPSGVFDAAALALAKTLRFQPARRGGHAVPTTTSLTIAWTIK